MAKFFYMGGYGFYVWTAYGIAFIVLFINVLIPLWRRRSLMRDLARRQRRERGRNDSTT
ncbi:MAG TPA: heme exporter protein CcmD [Gammaproteobacteria bacterium]|nr:heme exporter protein CcmD [Gammaproteobacteria bacterium]